MKRFGFVIAFLCTSTLLADEATLVVHFAPQDHTKLLAEFRVSEDFPDAGSECSNADCYDRYWVEKRVGPRDPIKVTHVGFVSGAAFPTLELTLEKAPPMLDKHFIVFAGMKNSKGEDLDWQEAALQPQVTQDEFDPGTMTYTSIEPVDLSAKHPKITAVNKDSGRTVDVPVKRVTPIGNGMVEHTLEIDPSTLPRGMKFKATVEGLETYDTEPLKAKTTLERADSPEGRDDAAFFANASAEANAVDDKRAYKFDLLIAPKFKMHRELWQQGPRLDTTIGNKVSEAPNKATFGWDLQHFIVSAPRAISSHSYTVGPRYTIDRKNENRELTLDAEYDPLLRAWEGHTIEQRRADAVRDDGDPAKVKWGWQIRPALGAEWGRHLESKDPNVEGDSLARLRGTITAMVERDLPFPGVAGTLKLSVSGTVRQLFSDEVVLDDDGNLVKTDRSDRSFARADLSYDLGLFALTLTHMNGRQPPAFTGTHSTSLGITVKY